LGQCSSPLAQVSVTVNPLPTLAPTATPNPVVLGEPVQFATPDQPGTTYIWSLGDGNAPLIGASGSHTYGQVGTYRVIVTAQRQGCTQQDTLEVEVVFPDEFPFVPNVFTPNGDGVNDVFRVTELVAPQKFELRIFDRWGTLIRVLESHIEGWDGTFGGQPAAEGQYFYNMRVTLLSGQEVIRTGSFTLLR
jgi:gliding motility-associated-like protein